MTTRFQLQLLEFLDAIGADVLAVYLLDPVGVSAENTSRLIFLEHDGFSVDIDFEGISDLNIQRTSQLDGQNDPAKLINLPNNASCFHRNLLSVTTSSLNELPFFLFSLLP